MKLSSGLSALAKNQTKLVASRLTQTQSLSSSSALNPSSLKIHVEQEPEENNKDSRTMATHFYFLVFIVVTLSFFCFSCVHEH